jgi:hypothetical protein
VTSGEIWGLPSWRSGGVPFVKAYNGHLPDDAIGIEFLAYAIPDKRYGKPEWRTPQAAADGSAVVWAETDSKLGDVIKLRVAITRVTQAI